jgi:hypothetical protein
MYSINMLVTKFKNENTTIMVEMLKGSEALKESLPYGAIRGMAKVFNRSDAWIGKVIAGKKVGNPLFIECAQKIAELSSENNEKLEQILKSYETN